MTAAVAQLFRHRELLYMLTRRDISIKYKQSVMGVMWAILMPALIVSAGVLVRVAFSKVSGVPVTLLEVAAVSVKALPWAFVVSAIRFATASLTSNSNLVTKISFPREVLPISAVLSQAFDLMIAGAMLVVLLAVLGVKATLLLWWVPVLLTILALLAVTVGLFLSAANLFFRDVKYLVEVIVTFAIFFTPVFYDTALFGPSGRWLLFNPVAPLLEGLSAVIVYGRAPELAWVAYSAALSVGGLFLGWAFFKKVEPTFAERV